MTVHSVYAEEDGHVLFTVEVLWVVVFVICREVINSGVGLIWRKGDPSNRWPSYSTKIYIDSFCIFPTSRCCSIWLSSCVTMACSTDPGCSFGFK